MVWILNDSCYYTVAPTPMLSRARILLKVVPTINFPRPQKERIAR